MALDLGVKDRTSVYNSKSFIEIPSWRRLLIVYNKTELEPYERSELGSDSSDKITKPVIQRKLYIQSSTNQLQPSFRNILEDRRRIGTKLA